MAMRAGVFPRVMLARMPPGGVIHPHIDANPAAKWPHKIHVPLSTNPGVVSFFGGEEHNFPVGEAVEVNNLGPHWVRNDGDTDRVHLIFEYYDADQPEPDWLEPFLRRYAAVSSTIATPCCSEARALRAAQRRSEALAALARLEALHPRFSRLHQERGHCHVLLGDAPAAIAALRRRCA
jgi:aspartyl/asparaginyl beta-hydroxylase (cupin superfamily)